MNTLLNCIYKLVKNKYKTRVNDEKRQYCIWRIQFTAPTAQIHFIDDKKTFEKWAPVLPLEHASMHKLWNNVTDRTITILVYPLAFREATL
jgi:hypothetical protein